MLFWDSISLTFGIDLTLKKLHFCLCCNLLNTLGFRYQSDVHGKVLTIGQLRSSDQYETACDDAIVTWRWVTCYITVAADRSCRDICMYAHKVSLARLMWSFKRIRPAANNGWADIGKRWANRKSELDDTRIHTLKKSECGWWVEMRWDDQV